MEDNVREIFGIKNSHDSLVTLEDLNLVDKFLFDEVMEDKEVYQMFVSIILENEIELLERPETEKELRISPLLRQVRLDVISMDKENNLYYTEMQKKNTGNLIRRSRYYQAQLDVSLLEPGSTDFNLLNDSCFILIAPFDLFGKGLFRYTFEGTCRECAGNVQNLNLGMEQGIRHGIEILLSTCSDLGISRETAYVKLKEKLQLTDAKTEEYMKLFWKNDSIIKS